MPGGGLDDLLRVEEVFAPLVVAAAQQAHQVTAGMEAERARLAKEFHARFFRGAAALTIVAAVATGDQILPGGLAGSRARDDVVEGHLAGGQHLVAILAGVAIAHQNVFARKSPGLMGNTPVFQQADDGGYVDSPARGVDLAR